MYQQVQETSRETRTKMYTPVNVRKIDDPTNRPIVILHTYSYRIGEICHYKGILETKDGLHKKEIQGSVQNAETSSLGVLQCINDALAMIKSKPIKLIISTDDAFVSSIIRMRRKPSQFNSSVIQQLFQNIFDAKDIEVTPYWVEDVSFRSEVITAVKNEIIRILDSNPLNGESNENHKTE